jgi:methylamine---glutamate N-methyltransferase subunit B
MTLTYPPSTATTVDLSESSVRELNQRLHHADVGSTWAVTNPTGLHNIAVGIDRDLDLTVHGHVGYYFAGMHQYATVTVHGSAGVGLAENIMSGVVHVTGDASQSAGATGNGGLVIIDGNTGARCGISMKGVDIVVGGDIGHASAFMAQAGRLVVCGDAGEGLGDSVYEARLYVKGSVASLGADCVEKPVRPEHLAELADLLARAKRDDDPAAFRRYGSGRTLYHFRAEHSSAY